MRFALHQNYQPPKSSKPALGKDYEIGDRKACEKCGFNTERSRSVKKQDGHQKQDCENAAVKRWLNKNPKNKYGYAVTLLGDDLYSR